MTKRRRAPSTESADDPADVVELLVRRGSFVERLAAGPVTKADIIEELPVSRSTVDRAVRELCTEGLATRTRDGYRLSGYGELSRRLFRGFLGDLVAVRRSATALRDLAPAEPLDPAFFRDGTVRSVGGDESERPAKRLRELVADADELWTLTPSPHFELLSLAHRRVVEEDLRFHLIHSEETLERLTFHHPDVVESAISSGNLWLYRCPSVPSVGLLKGRTPNGWRVLLVLYGDQGHPEIVVTTGTDEAVAQFDEVFHTHRETATLVAFGE